MARRDAAFVVVVVVARLAAMLALALPPALVAAQATGQGEHADDAVAQGRRIYREGLLGSGQPLVGTGAAGVRLSGPQAACITCHRRSGYGSSEGSVNVRAITGPALFGERVAPQAPGAESIIKAPLRHALAPAGGEAGAGGAAMAQAQALRAARGAAFAGARPRPAYDEALLARAIRQGVDVANHAMDPAMPRYELAEPDLRALTAYLRTLSAQIAPGVTEEQVHFATVIQPGVDAATRAAMLEVLQAFVRDRNLGRRAEQRREQAGLLRANRVYREWVLHVWDLSGEPALWPQQLAARYREQPVFALVGGLGAQDWSPIHDFCEAFELPEVFPQTSLPGNAGSGFYSIYLNRGAVLEARALARFLAADGERGAAPVQVFRDEGAGRVAAAAFREAWAAPLAERVLRGPADAAFWSRLAAEHPGAPLILWLGENDLAGLAALAGAAPAPRSVYLSHGLGGERAALSWPEARLPLRVVYPLDLPAMRAARLEVVRQWMKNSGIALTHEEVQMNAYLAATVTGMAVTHSADTYSREYFVERVEHRMGTAVELSVFPRLSLGPGQRFASKGSYVAEFAGSGGPLPRIVSDWIVP